MARGRPIRSLPCVCTTVRKASRALSRLFDESLAPADMTAAQLAILRGIHRGEPSGRPLSRLAESLVMDRTSLYRSLAPMIRKGWIVLKPGAAGRTRLAVLTRAGVAATDGAAAHWEAVQTRVLAAIGADRWTTLQRDILALAELGANLSERETGTATVPRDARRRPRSVKSPGTGRRAG